MRGTAADGELRITTRLRCACGCIRATHWATISFRSTGAGVRVNLPASSFEISSKSLTNESRCAYEWRLRGMVIVAGRNHCDGATVIDSIRIRMNALV